MGRERRGGEPANAVAIAAIVIAAVGIGGRTASARAQAAAVAADPAATALERALLARYPEREIVPRSCRASAELEVIAGRMCLADPASGRVRAVRRVALGGELRAARVGGEVLFTVSDVEGVTTRYAGRVWRWDLARDAYLGLARTDEESYQALLYATSFGALYSTRAGWQLMDASGSRRVSAPWDPTDGSPGSFVVHGGVTYLVRGDYSQTPPRTLIERVALAGTAIRVTPHASLAGDRVVEDDGLFVHAVQARRGRFLLHVLALPATEAIDVEYPEGQRRPTSGRRIDATHVELAGPRGERVIVDLTARTASAASSASASAGASESESAARTTVLASSLVTLAPVRDGGVMIGSRERTFVLGASGVATPRRAPTAARSPCRCDARAMVCRRGPRIEGACPDVQELETIREYGERVGEATQFTTDGRFRIDRLEADYARITRLSDGARVWLRVLGTALLAQTDDGHFFLSDPALSDALDLREGRALTSAPVVALGSRAAALRSEHLIEELFAAPAVAARAPE